MNIQIPKPPLNQREVVWLKNSKCPTIWTQVISTSYNLLYCHLSLKCHYALRDLSDTGHLAKTDTRQKYQVLLCRARSARSSIDRQKTHLQLFLWLIIIWDIGTAHLTLSGVESFKAEMTNIEKPKLVNEIIYSCKQRHRYTVTKSLPEDALQSDNSHRGIGTLQERRWFAYRLCKSLHK